MPLTTWYLDPSCVALPQLEKCAFVWRRASQLIRWAAHFPPRRFREERASVEDLTVITVKVQACERVRTRLLPAGGGGAAVIGSDSVLLDVASVVSGRLFWEEILACSLQTPRAKDFSSLIVESSSLK